MSLIAHTKTTDGNWTTPAINTTGAKLIVAFTHYYSTYTSFTDSYGNTWIPLNLQASAGDIYSRIFYCINPIVGAGHTFTSGSGVTAAAQILAFDDVVIFSGESGATGASLEISKAPGAISIAGPGLFVCGFSQDGAGSTTATIDSAFTISDAVGKFSTYYISGSAYKYKPAAGNENPIWTYDNVYAGSRGSAVVMAAFIAPPVSIDSATVPDAMRSVPYSFKIAASGGTGGLTFSKTSGTLPPGITLNTSTGVISGTPTAAGSYSFTIRATDAAAAFDDQAFTLAVIDYIGMIFALEDLGGSGTSIGTPDVDSSGVNLIVVAVASAGLVGTYPINVTDNKGNTFIGLTPRVHPGDNFTTKLLYCINPVVGAGHNFTITGTLLGASVLGFADDVAIYQAETGNGDSKQPGNITPGDNGFLLIAAAEIANAASNVPTIDSGFYIAGVTPFADMNNLGVSLAFKKQKTAKSENPTWTINTKAGVAMAAFKITPDISAGSLPAGQLTVDYDQYVSAAGGSPPAFWSVASGVLPPGLTLNPTNGHITGIPTTIGVYPFTLTIVDAGGISDTEAFSITIVAYSGPPRFPGPTVNGGILWEHFNLLPTDYGAITRSHTYEDDGRSFNETTATPAERWEITFTGLSWLEMQIFETFANAMRLTVPFEFRDKWGVTHYGVRIERYERSHNKNISWANDVRFILCKYP